MKNYKFTALILLQVIVLITVLILLLRDDTHKSNLSYKASADKLHAAGLLKEAAHFYKKSFMNDTLSKKDKLKIALTLGELNKKQGLYEKSLSWFYMAEELGSSSRNQGRISKNIVSLLEKLGKHSFSKLSLEKRTNLQNAKAPGGAKQLAKVGEQIIYDTDLRTLMDNLRGYTKEKIDKKMKMQLLQKLIADELLYQKALRLNLTESDEYKKKVNLIGKNVLVELVLKDEVQNKIKLSDFKLKKFFEENRKMFDQPLTYNLGIVSTKDKKEADKWLNQINKGKKLKDLKIKNYHEQMANERYPLKGFDQGITNEILETISKSGKMKKLHGGNYYILQTIQKIPGKKSEFAEVKEQVKQTYQMQETQNLYQEMIQDLMNQEEVKVYTENI